MRMPLEIEIKLKVDSHAPTLASLRENGATHAGFARETNIFFDRPEGSLRKADSGLRVRLSCSAGQAADQALVTFKGPAAPDGLRARNAFDLQTEPAKQVVPLLEALGFVQVFLFEKDRDSWLFEACHVELDTLPHFGHFIEIEGPSESAVRTAQHALGLGDSPSHPKSYSHLVSEFLAIHPDKMHALRF
jgi:predicted adenylyl cyclase CyaB